MSLFSRKKLYVRFFNENYPHFDEKSCYANICQNFPSYFNLFWRNFSLKISGVKCWIYYFSIVLHLDTLSVEGPHKFYIGWRWNGGVLFKRGGGKITRLNPQTLFYPFPLPYLPPAPLHTPLPHTPVYWSRGNEIMIRECRQLELLDSSSRYMLVTAILATYIEV